MNCAREKCADACYRHVCCLHLPSRSWQLLLSGRETASKQLQPLQELRSCTDVNSVKNTIAMQDYEWNQDTGRLGQQSSISLMPIVS